MALITCPECGRNNVSNSATGCPNCGYNIQAHFARLEDETNKLLNDIREEKEFDEIASKNKQIQDESRKKNLANVKLPTKTGAMPDGITGWLVFGCILTALGTIFLITMPKETPAGSVICLFWGIICLCYWGDHFIKSLSLYKHDMKIIHERGEKAYREYALERNNDRFNAMIAERNAREASRPSTQSMAQMMGYTAGLKCPACGGHETNKISLGRKVVSTELFGLASNDIGKQYECKSCGHKF